MGLRSPSESAEPRVAVRIRAQRSLVGTSHEVCFPYSVSPLGAAALWPGLPHPAACTFRFSRPLGALVRSEPAGLVSCQIRSWGCALQSLAPLPQPYVVSDAAPLVALGGEPNPSDHRAATAETAATRHSYGRAGTRSRLQGFAPRKSPPPCTGGLGRFRRVALLGFCPPGCSPPTKRPIQSASPHGLGSSGANDRKSDPTGYSFRRDGLASLETADPPGLLRLMTTMNVRAGRGSGVASSGFGVRHRPLPNPL
jgi:hypothetical protein